MLNDDSKFGLENKIEKTVKNWLNWIFGQFSTFFGQKMGEIIV